MIYWITDNYTSTQAMLTCCWRRPVSIFNQPWLCCPCRISTCTYESFVLFFWQCLAFDLLPLITLFVIFKLVIYIVIKMNISNLVSTIQFWNNFHQVYPNKLKVIGSERTNRLNHDYHIWFWFPMLEGDET